MSDDVCTMLRVLADDPADETAWKALGDALEEAGQVQRASLARDAHLLPECTNSIGMKFVLIPAGIFLMGSPDDEKGRSDSEGPLHEVEITRAFYLGVTPVTQSQYERVMGSHPSFFAATARRPAQSYLDCPARGGVARVHGLDTSDYPVENVSWTRAVAFCKKLGGLSAEKEAGRKYRLPTEAQWEHACRSGAASHEVFHFGSSLSSDQANFRETDLKRSCAVGSGKPNGFGLYDMHGNVWEWCADWFDEDYYSTSPRKDPKGPKSGSVRVTRGGSWESEGRSCRSACRRGRQPASPRNIHGFRVVMSVVEVEE